MREYAKLISGKVELKGARLKGAKLKPLLDDPILKKLDLTHLEESIGKYFEGTIGNDELLDNLKLKR